MANNDFVVFGLGKFGRSVAQTLAENGKEVLAIDNNEEIIQDIADVVTHAVQADVTDSDALKALGVGNFDVAVIAISNNLQASIMSTILAKEMGVKARTQVASSFIVKLLGLFHPLMREMPEMMYQYDRDYVFNSDKFSKHFNVKATSYITGIREIVLADYKNIE